MIKYLFIGFNALIIFFLNIFSDGVKVEHNLPSEIKAGSEFVAEFKIKKDVGIQFAKLQIDIPEGIVATESDSKSGQFSMNGNVAKIIWMQFPSENEVTVKIKLNVGAAVSGTKTITGKLQFVSNNEKMSAEISPHELKIISNSEITENNTTNNNVSNQDKNDQNLSKADEPVAGVKVERKISKNSSSNTFKVEVKIKKDNLKGFAKYSEVIPAGLEAFSGGGSAGATFKFVDGKVSIIWATLPKDENISAYYSLKTSTEFTTNPIISGAFSYLEDEQAMKMKAEDIEVPLITKDDSVKSQEITDLKTDEKENKEEIKTAITNTIAPVQQEKQNEEVEKLSDNIKKNENNQQNDQVKSNEDLTTKQDELTEKIKKDTVKVIADNSSQMDKKVSENNKANTPDAAIAGLNFHIQIGAFKNPPATSYFVTRFNITEKISTDMNEGMTKFLVGKFSEYKSSRDYRETVKSKGVQGAFVTAYNSGKRITVQEALMLLNQKWYK